MKVALIDGDHIIYTACHCKKTGEKDAEGKDIVEVKTLADVKAAVDSYMRNMLNAVKATHYIGALTVGSNFRYKVYPDYKANRRDFVKPQHFDACKEYLITRYWFTWDMSGQIEADDIVYIMYCSQLPYAKGDKTLLAQRVIISPDKDILNLEGTHFNPKKFEWVHTSKEQADYYFWTSMITGDPADNIKGIPGKGKAFAKQLLSDSRFPAARVLKNYILHFGEEKGVEEYYKNYKCLKIIHHDQNSYNFNRDPLSVTIMLDEYKKTTDSSEKVKVN